MFTELSRLSVLTTAEVVCINRESGAIRVLLTKRPEDDPWWPGKWHSPGATILASDRVEYECDFRDAINRVLGVNGELQGIHRTGEPIYLTGEMRKTVRGTEYSAIHYVEVDGSPAVGKYFTLDETAALGDELIEHHHGMLARVVEVYRQHCQHYL